MPFTVLSACGKLPSWVVEGCESYSKRLSREYSLKWIDLPLVDRPKNKPVHQIKSAETARLVEAVPRSSYVIALDESGIAMSTRKMADKVQKCLVSNSSICFVIGGPDGLDLELRETKNKRLSRPWADAVWSLSGLTFPHPMVRLLLVEQLYRVWSVNAGHPYHRD